MTRLAGFGLVLAMAACLPAFHPTAYAAEGRSCVVLVSGQSEVFDLIYAGVNGALGYCPQVLDLRKSKAADCRQALAPTQGKGIIAIGTTACDFVCAHGSPQSRVALCTYGPLRPRPKSGGLWLRLSALGSLGSNLGLIRTLVPRARKIAILHCDMATGLTAERSAAGRPKAAHFRLKRFTVTDWKHFKGRLVEAIRWSDVLWLPPDPRLMTHSALKFTLITALGARKPVFTFSSRIVRGGALAGLVPDARQIGREAGAWIAGKARSETSPADEGKANLYVNREVARFMAIPIPTLLERRLPRERR